MLKDAKIHVLKDRLIEEIAALDDEDAQSADDRSTVILDQQSVGRLSRMDALQRQAMAEATLRRRAARRHRIEAALARIGDDEFGYCQSCGEEIASARLDLDPAVATCVSCAYG